MAIPIGGGAKAAPSTVSVTTSATALCAENYRRKSVTFRNTDASASVYLGDATVTSSGGTKGIELKFGETLVDASSKDAWYAITASGTVAVAVLDVA